MGPFSSNTPPPSPPQGGTNLPVPDVDGTPHVTVPFSNPDNARATRKWLIVSLLIAGIMALAGITTFGIYVFASNTSSYMLGAAMQNLLQSPNEAGTIHYETNQGQTHTLTPGTFLSYTDPTDHKTSTIVLSIGEGASLVSGLLRLFPDAAYIQAAGLANVGTLASSAGMQVATLSEDQITRLSALDGQWYQLSTDDVLELGPQVPPQIKGGITSSDLEMLKQLYHRHPFLVSGDQLPDERIHGINSIHFKVHIDQVKWAAFLQALKAESATLSLGSTDLQFLTSNEGILGDIEVWIARSDRTFQQIRVNRRISNSASNTLTLTFRSELAAAQRQTVVRPEDAKSGASLVRDLYNIFSAPTAPIPSPTP